MSSHSRNHRGFVPALLTAAFALLCGAGPIATAQNQAVPALDHPYPKWEIFGGYSFFYPDTTVHALNPGALVYLHIRQESNPRGIGASVTYNFNRWLGLTGDFSGYKKSGEGPPNLATGYVGNLDDSGFFDVSIGPKLTYRKPHFAPFLEGMVGLQRLSTEAYGTDNRIGFVGGGGIDVPLKPHFALRLIQADYVRSNQHFGPSTVPSTNVRGVRLQTGAVFMFGGMVRPPPIAYSCPASPVEVYPGEAVTVTGDAQNLNPKKTPTYRWTSTGGNVSGSSSTSNIDTTGLAPGTYTVNGHIMQGSKAGQFADCSSTFTVKPYGPPTILCSADPAVVNPGDPSTITAQGTSPQNRLLTYSYGASAGQIGGSTNIASLTTTGIAPGIITVTCNLADDTGQTASATTSVTINAPPTPMAPKTETLCSINFGRDKRRPARVDNEAKACLDEVALNLQRSADAKAVLVGNSDPAEKNTASLAHYRAVNTKSYLVKEKGVDPSRVEIRTGHAGTSSVQNYIVPSGANFDQDVPSTLSVETP